MCKSTISALVVVSVAVSGCSPMAMMSAESLTTQKDTALCGEYASSRSAKVKAELVRRNAISAAEWDTINKKQIQIGMSELAFLCSWGFPGGWGAIRETTYKYGTATQYVYRSCRGCASTYVYTRDGKVSAWQD